MPLMSKQATNRDKPALFTKTSLLITVILTALWLPLVLKAYSLSISALKPWYDISAYSEELLYVAGFALALSLARGLLRYGLLGMLLLADLLLTVNAFGYRHLGAYYEAGLFSKMPLLTILDLLKSYLTGDNLVLITQFLLASLLAALGMLLLYRRVSAMQRLLRPLLVILIILAIGLRSSLAAPQAIERLSLSVSLQSLLFAGQDQRKNLTRDLVKGRNSLDGLKDRWHTLQSPAPIDELAGKGPYNIVIYSMESTRAYSSSAYRGTTDTSPFLRRMRDSHTGLFFTHAYASNPRSIQALTTLLTGMYPPLAIKPWSSERYLRQGHTLPEILRSNNYHTAFFVNSMLRFDNREQFLPNIGFAQVEGVEGTFISDDDRVLKDKLLEHFSRAEQQHQPLFSVLLASSAHSPFKYPGFPEDNGLIDLQQAREEAIRLHIPDNDKLYSELYPNYLRSIRHQDDVAGLLFDTLQQQGHLDDTIFVVLGDHGETFGEHPARGGIRGHGQSLYEESIKVPLWIYHPDLEGRHIATPISFIDIAPTLLGMGNISSTTAFFGRNIIESSRAQLFFFNFLRWPAAAVLEYPLKLIQYGLSGDDSEYELFDLSRDPYERHPISDHPREPLLREAIHDSIGLLARFESEYKQLAREEEIAHFGESHFLALPFRLIDTDTALDSGVFPLDIPLSRFRPIPTFLLVECSASDSASIRIELRFYAGPTADDDAGQPLRVEEYELKRTASGKFVQAIPLNLDTAREQRATVVLSSTQAVTVNGLGLM